MAVHQWVEVFLLEGTILADTVCDIELRDRSSAYGIKTIKNIRLPEEPFAWPGMFMFINDEKVNDEKVIIVPITEIVSIIMHKPGK